LKFLVTYACAPFRSGAPHIYFGAHRLKNAGLEDISYCQ